MSPNLSKQSGGKVVECLAAVLIGFACHTLKTEREPGEEGGGGTVQAKGGERTTPLELATAWIMHFWQATEYIL